MAIETKKPFRTAYLTGLGLNLLSLIIYLLISRQNNNWGFFSGAFFVNFGIGIAYLILLLVQKLNYSKPRPNISYECWINAIVLFTISAFSLNREMYVFAKFPTWLNVYLLLMIGLFFVYPYINKFPNYLKTIVYLLSGSILIFALYMTIYLMPLMPISVIGLLFFGISVHTFIPAAWSFLVLHFIFKKVESSRLKHFFWPGMLVPLLFLGAYLYKWNNIQTQAKDILSGKNLQLSNHLPDAIQLAQKLPSDPLTEEILVSPFKSQRFWDNGFWFDNSGSTKFHDPLSVIAIAFFGDLNIDRQTVETLLNIRKDYRHKTTRKLWTGTSLTTSSISSNIRVFPQYRFAYHEKTFVIHHDENKTENDFWFTSSAQEALYTFHVPEGSIVTSLSLWINGKEQKSRLTTAQKADSAYTTIVGVQRRDPAIVHWQEGNTVTVNIFPCTSAEDRTFKIGFTTPLSLKEGHLNLENIWFEGPDFNQAREATKISFEGKSIPVITTSPGNFEKDAAGDYVYKGEYSPYWSMEMETIPLSQNKFSFNGYDYSLKEMQVQPSSVNIRQIYLDITKEWDKEEYNAILTQCAGKDIYAWTPEKVKITSENKDMIWNELRNNQFSMPFLYDVSDPANTVIIIKSGATSPLLCDMNESDYAGKTIDYLMKSENKICVLNMGRELAPFWRSLLEFRLITCTSSDLKNVTTIVNTGKFNFIYEDSSTVSLNESNLSIIKQPSAVVQKTGDAPDHLLRLFAYNDVLRKIGKKYFEKEKYENELFREAEEGYVVTPVTGMIVLESEADYEKMGIEKNTNTVGNAGIVGGGAVPEPHEWLLIALASALVLRFIYLKRKQQHGSYIGK